MSAAVDANVLLYASNPESPVQRDALETLAQWAEGPDLLYVFWPVAMAYLRIATDPRLFTDPLDPSTAVANISAAARSRGDEDHHSRPGVPSLPRHRRARPVQLIHFADSAARFRPG